MQTCNDLMLSRVWCAAAVVPVMVGSKLVVLAAADGMRSLREALARVQQRHDEERANTGTVGSTAFAALCQIKSQRLGYLR